LDRIIEEIQKLAARHVQYGVHPDHYAPVGQALLWTLEKGLGKSWNKEAEAAWIKCYTILSAAMIGASAEVAIS
jgi:nitric oxide dioxygenase